MFLSKFSSSVFSFSSSMMGLIFGRCGGAFTLPREERWRSGSGDDGNAILMNSVQNCKRWYEQLNTKWGEILHYWAFVRWISIRLFVLVGTVDVSMSTFRFGMVIKFRCELSARAKWRASSSWWTMNESIYEMIYDMVMIECESKIKKIRCMMRCMKSASTFPPWLFFHNLIPNFK